MFTPIIAVVTRETRLAGLKARYATMGAAAFRMKQAVEHEVERRRLAMLKRGREMDAADEMMLMEAAEELADESEYESEDEIYQRTVKRLMAEIDLGSPLKKIDRTFLPNFDFGRCMLVVVVGPDGLVANTAKYVGDLPIIGVNPDPRETTACCCRFRSAMREVPSAASSIANPKRAMSRSPK
jgi:hypothetical protein